MFRIDIRIVNLFHVFVIGALLMYIGMKGNDTPAQAYYVLFSLIILLFFIVPRPKAKGFTYWNIVHISHYFLVIPSLFYLAYFGFHKKLNDNVYNVLMYLGGGISLYHGYKFATRVL